MPSDMSIHRTHIFHPFLLQHAIKSPSNAVFSPGSATCLCSNGFMQVGCASTLSCTACQAGSYEQPVFTSNLTAYSSPYIVFDTLIPNDAGVRLQATISAVEQCSAFVGKIVFNIIIFLSFLLSLSLAPTQYQPFIGHFGSASTRMMFSRMCVKNAKFSGVCPPAFVFGSQ